MNLIVYYSRSGSVQKVAEQYAQKFGGELLPIVSKVNYSGVLGYLRAIIDAMRKRSPQIEQITADFGDYTRVVICGAVWASTIAAPVRTFLRRYGSVLPEVEYLILRGNPVNKYEAVFSEMDALCGKQHVAAASFRDGEIL